MSSLNNIAKKTQRIHKERSQLTSRVKLGLLERKKDYKRRAKNYQNNNNVLRALRRKAQERNPDEFYFHMLNSKVEDGVHHEVEKPKEFTDDQIKLMQTQDIRYIKLKRSMDSKKIEKLQANHHLLDVEDRPKNKHTFFVGSRKEAKSFDVVKRLDTHEALIDRTYNRITMDRLKKEVIVPEDVHHTLMKGLKERKREYKELAERVSREQKLSLLEKKMELKRHLANKKCTPSQRIAPGTVDSAPIYKWKTERQK